MRLLRDAGVVSWDGGRVLLGGSPLRVLRLTDRGARLVAQWWQGAPVGADGASQSLAARIVVAGVAHPVYDAGRANVADVTVVVPVRNDAAAIDRLQRTLRDVAEVIVVDDGSNPPLSRAAIRHGVARGPAAARNAGYRRVRTPLVAFLDADTAPEPGWLDRLLPHFEDPGVAAVAPRVRSLPGRSTLARYESQQSPLDMGTDPGPVQPGSRISYVPSAALVVRTSALQNVGGFDEGLRFGEDVDLVWRLVAAGHRVRYEPSSVVGHAPRPTWRSWLRQRFDYGTSAGPLARRHGSAVAPARLSFWSATMWLAMLAGRAEVAAGVAATSAVLLTRKLGRLGVPARDSALLALRGNLGSARILGAATARTWWPLAIPLLARSRTGRVALALIAARYPAEWLRRRPDLDVLRWSVLRATDDLTYGAGVLCGSFRARAITAFLPDISDLPWQHRPSVAVEEQCSHPASPHEHEGNSGSPSCT